MSYTTYEPSLNYGCWVIAWVRYLTNIMFKVTTPRSKVKCQKFAYRWTSWLIGSSLIPIRIKSDKIGKMTLTYFFNFQPQCQGQRSNIKIDLPRNIYGIRQHCTWNIKLLPFTVPEKLSRQRFCSEGHWVKVKGRIQKINILWSATCHHDATCWISTFSDLRLLSNGWDIPDASEPRPWPLWPQKWVILAHRRTRPRSSQDASLLRIWRSYVHFFKSYRGNSDC